MTVKRAAAWIGGSTLLAAWLAAAASPSLAPPPRADAAKYQIAEPDRAAIALAAEADRLHARLGVVPVPRPVTRNPFLFASRIPPVVPIAAVPEALASAAASTAVPITLLGVAEDGNATKVMRTAILSLRGELLLVKEGESIGNGRYRLTQIGADAIDVEDTTDSHTIRIALP